VRVLITSPREAAQLELTTSAGDLRDVSVDGEPLGADSPGAPLGRVQIAGAPQGEPVTVEATLEDAATLELVETTSDPTIAGGWVEPGEDVSLMQPRVQIVVEV